MSLRGKDINHGKPRPIAPRRLRTATDKPNYFPFFLPSLVHTYRKSQENTKRITGLDPLSIPFDGTENPFASRCLFILKPAELFISKRFITKDLHHKNSFPNPFFFLSFYFFFSSRRTLISYFSRKLRKIVAPSSLFSRLTVPFAFYRKKLSHKIRKDFF